MRVRADWLTVEDERLIYEQALVLLERVGMRMKGSRALGLLAERGAQVDAATEIVRFPAELVEAALRQCPRAILMAGATTDRDVLLDENERPHFTTGGCAARTLDMGDGKVRPSTLDLRQSVALCDELDEVDVFFTAVAATDVAAERRELVEYDTLLTETAKHHIFVNSPRQAESLIRIAEVLSGDLARFRERPRFTTLLTVASPLQIDGKLLDFHARMAAIGTPVGIFPSPLCGATAPVTVAGTVTQTLAEFLGAATAMQLISPGARLLMGSIGSVLDMHSAMASFAAPEAVAISAIGAQVAHSLGLPVQCAGLPTDAKYAGIQAGYEKAFKGMATAIAGADMISGGIGLLESSSLLYLPQIIIDAEMAAMIQRTLAGIEVSLESVMGEMIQRVGIGGDFLRERETTRRLRSGEHFAPLISTRLSYDAWATAGRSEVDVAKERVQQLLAARAEREPYLSVLQQQELANICDTRRSGLNPSRLADERAD
jgi:trimethylamine--corrinoid protein Co-methyltransferase